MMNLPGETIEELKQIYKKEFNLDMSDDKAQAEAQRALLFFYEFLKWEAEDRAKVQKFYAMRSA